MHYTFTSTPTYTLKSRTETITKSNQTISKPGPSDYEPKKQYSKPPTISTNLDKRELFKTAQPFPGPGTHQAKSYITDGPKKSMSFKLLEHLQRNPGPHQYDNNTLKVKLNAPEFSMSARSKSYREIITDKNAYKPGPTVYDPKQPPLRLPNPVMGTATRKDLTETQKTPGPDQYQREKADVFASTTNPRCSIGQQFRNTTFGQKQVTPGPCVYDIKSFVEENKNHQKGFTCRSKTTDLLKRQISKFPAPGHYQSHLKNKSQAPRIANPLTSRKTFMDDMQDFKRQYPGPGIHSPKFSGTKYKSAKSFNFGKSNRKSLYQNEKTPAPNQYRNEKINVLNSAPRFSVSKTIPKNEFLQVNPELPAPGQYEPNFSQVKKRTVGYNQSKQKRPDFEKHKFTPSPGSYNIAGKQQGPTWVFSKDKRQAFTDNPNEAKRGQIYQIPGMIPNPPSYMNVTKKIDYSNGLKSQFNSTGLSKKQ